uniref:Uncharacterized protein n=1 Tax=Arundo donax TaxID=35708 RepID=A0A0A9FWR7_ARUDO
MGFHPFGHGNDKSIQVFGTAYHHVFTPF